MAKLNVWNFTIGHEEYDGWTGGANSAGGWEVKLSFKNNTPKTIKYIYFWFVPYNAVGDAVSCTVTNESEKGVKCTGPVAPGEMRQGVHWDVLWWNWSIKTIKMTQVYVEYMDGTKENIPLSEVSFAVPEGAGGCYVATAVYGSYDCPQVWTLRRYRDYTLAKTWYGRLFIKTYYAVSPTLVKWFGNTEWFKKMWKGKLDRMVAKLQSEGVEFTPYQDK